MTGGVGQGLSIVPCLWGCCNEHSAYITTLGSSLKTLSTAMEALNSLAEDVKNTVKLRENIRRECTKQVQEWLQSVKVIENEVDEILLKGGLELGNKCLGGCCPKDCWSSYKIGKKVQEMIPRVTKKIDDGRFDDVVRQLLPPVVDEQQMDNDVVGFESKFAEVWGSVQNNDSHVIGLVGMGGVGKTTLMKLLNNEFLKDSHTYELVIWIEDAKPANLERIQDVLRSKLKITENSQIFTELKMKKFVVLLDNMWEKLDLLKVGIPKLKIDSPGSKIVFTTRSEEVCRFMEADKVIKVDCLLEDGAFNLFCSKLQEGITKSHPEIQGYIKNVASQCKGLPLALISVGCAMKRITEACEWKKAKTRLEEDPSAFLGMAKDVFPNLAISYDNLLDPMVKKCFEYCSLYPKDHNIPEEEVIKLWLAEGFISVHGSMEKALDQGRRTIESLKQACLLETGKSLIIHSREQATVKMHGVVRDMALWVVCAREEKKNKFCVEVARGYHDAEKISLRGTGITTLSLEEMSRCSNLTTLLIQDTGVEELSGEIVHSMNVLKVLDLSGNRRLTRLPIASCLTNLEYLNIAWTKVPFPVDVSQWQRLRFLIVDDRIIIPREVLSCLCSLQMFEQLYVPREKIIPIESERESMEKEMLSELKGLNNIMDIRLALHSESGIEILLGSPTLQKCTTRLAVKQVKFSPDKIDFGKEVLTKHLESLEVYFCEIPEITLGRPSLTRGHKLCEVSLFYCSGIRNLTSLKYVPNLSILSVSDCESMEELIGEERNNINIQEDTLFSSLTSLTIEYSPKLRSICPQSPLPFSSLKYVKIKKCKNLIKLPLDSNTASTKLQIRGERNWWDGLKWDSDATKNAFTPKFIEC